MTPKLAKRAQRDLRALPPPDASAIIAAIDRLCSTGIGDVVKLRATAMPTWRLRVGDFRVIFTRDAETMWVERVGDRRDVYRG